MNTEMDNDNGAYDPMNDFQETNPPSYKDAFPSLPVSGTGSQDHFSQGHGQWTKKLSMKVSNITQVFHVPLEERRFKEMNESRFGESGEQQKICQDIMIKTGVTIEMSLARDESLSVVITGKGENVMKARRMVVNQLQTQGSASILIPKDHHRFILGRNGIKLQKLELETATKITIPRQEEKSDHITIVGTKEGIDKARHELQIISDEQAKLAFERLPIDKRYHPFINGPNNSVVKALIESTGANIHVPPPSVLKDEVVVSGEKDGVMQAVKHITKIYEEKKRKCQPVSVEVRKSQHKYVIGPKGCNLAEILELTGVSVEVPPLDSPSGTITLIGEADKLGTALTMVYSKASSIIVADVDAPSWLHRYIIGKKGGTIRQITESLPKVHIEFTHGDDKIQIEGPPEEVEQARQALQTVTDELCSRMDFAEIKIDPKYHRHIIGRSGANIQKVKDETGVTIKIPSDNELSSIIRIEGDPKGVKIAKAQLLEIANRLENERTKDVLIEQRFHKTIIGAKGEKVKEIREKYPEVLINFPDAGKKSDVVTLRGPKNDLEKCAKHLKEIYNELMLNNYQAEVKIFKKYHKNIIGKGGANIKKIREETDTRIDLPYENSDSDIILITGKKANVEKAKAKIELVQKDLASLKEINIEIPHKFHNSIIGSKGRLIRAIMEDCGGVIVRFPPEGSSSDKVIIKGPKDDVESAKKQLLELATEREKNSFTAEVKAKPEYHKFLIGRQGVNIRKVRDDTGARIIFPDSTDEQQDVIIIMGKDDSVKKAKAQLELLVKNMENIVEAEARVDPKHHRHFVARRGEVLRQIAEDYGGVTVSFPRSNTGSDRVTLKGAKDCVESAKKKLLEIVEDLEAQITMECIIPQKYHRTVMGAKGSKVQEVTRDHDVQIKFPDRPVNGEVSPRNGNEENGHDLPNGDAGSDVGSDGAGDRPNKCDIILVTGRKENCEAAIEALKSQVPITDEINIPFEFHRFIIGQKGKDVRRMMEEFDVNISIPPQSQESDTVKVIGAPANVNRARLALDKKVEDLEKERDDRVAKGFKITLNIDPKYHSKIIGRKGAVISKIREQHDVIIQFPERNQENQDAITITGYEESANAASEDIMKIVRELEDMVTLECQVDSRVHPRIIGAKGRALRKIMEDFRVDVKFPRANDENPDLIEITGAEEDCLDARDHILNLEEEFMQDVRDRELLQQYVSPRARETPQTGPSNSKGFILKDTPWDMNNVDDFPTICSTAAPAASKSWGPSRKS